MGSLNLIPVVDEGLGNSTYLLDLGDGRALVMDPERDLRQVRAEASRRELAIAYAVETHLHADFISGVAELAEIEGATVLAPEVGARGFAHTGLTDGQSVELGRFTLEALHTPGHSPEHLSYLLREGGDLAGIFTGGSLMVGTAGRTDLVSPEMTVPLARAQYRSLQRLMEFPDATPVWPTHGAGSFCSAGGSGERVTTIGAERATNPLLQLDGEEAFVEALLGTVGTFPDYFLRLGEINKRGPAVLPGEPRLTPLSAVSVEALLTDGAQVIDTRQAADFAAGHVPGSISIPFRPVFATWLGWLATPEAPVVIVRGPDQDPVDIATAAAKVGFDTLAGELDGGYQVWGKDHAGTEGVALIGPEQMIDRLQAGASVLDIRQGGEYAAGHVPGAVNVELGYLPDSLDAVPAGPVIVMCGHGERAMGGASILAASGRTGVSVFNGGPGDWAAAAGQQLEAGTPLAASR
ncbi:rhodanese-like domain-containing protein [Arthrobacter sp. NQ7]|uniref:MBL fold metallo-hydrolase n=1 Tax=Arthrobacter sp. NQ7 TaxID=3032303 RepID=UPI00240FB63D|nr:MBL fold metallo-hydrolase [Arthrobacter sp. NQ7]MDJ0457039.1 rhodanese-like domain-containing protein [Arthrobacter sp. NQ7]